MNHIDHVALMAQQDPDIPHYDERGWPVALVGMVLNVRDDTLRLRETAAKLIGKAPPAEVTFLLRLGDSLDAGAEPADKYMTETAGPGLAAQGGAVDVPQAPTAAQPTAWPAGLLERIKAAEKRIQDNHAPRRIPADPHGGDVDLVLAEVRYLIEGRWPPFWIAPAGQVPAGVNEVPAKLVTHCPWCAAPVSVADEPYCANADCRWNNGGTAPAGVAAYGAALPQTPKEN